MLVAYASRYGHTQRYARWIAEALRCELARRENVDRFKLAQQDVVIFGGALYAGRVNGLDLVTKNLETLAGKRVYLFLVGLESPGEGNTLPGTVKLPFPEDWQPDGVFYFRGGMDYSRLSLVHKMMMTAIIWITRRKAPQERTADDQMILELVNKEVDLSRKEAIQGLVSQVKKDLASTQNGNQGKTH